MMFTLFLMLPLLFPAKHADQKQLNQLVEIDLEAIYLFIFITDMLIKNFFFSTVLIKSKSWLNKHPILKTWLIRIRIFILESSEQNKNATPPAVIKTEESEKNSVIIVTNYFNLSAKKIGDLYRYRYKIEIFSSGWKQPYG